MVEVSAVEVASTAEAAGVSALGAGYSTALGRFEKL